MDEAAKRDQPRERGTGERRHEEAPSDERRHRERRHEEAERIAVEGDDLSEIFYSVLGRERPHVDEPQPEGVSWPPRLGKRSKRGDDSDRPDRR